MGLLEGWLIVTAVSVVVLYFLVKNAPEGYEDDEGFHYGKPDDVVE